MKRSPRRENRWNEDSSGSAHASSSPSSHSRSSMSDMDAGGLETAAKKRKDMLRREARFITGPAPRARVEIAQPVVRRKVAEESVQASRQKTVSLKRKKAGFTDDEKSSDDSDSDSSYSELEHDSDSDDDSQVSSQDGNSIKSGFQAEDESEVSKKIAETKYTAKGLSADEDFLEELDHHIENPEKVQTECFENNAYIEKENANTNVNKKVSTSRHFRNDCNKKGVEDDEEEEEEEEEECPTSKEPLDVIKFAVLRTTGELAEELELKGRPDFAPFLRSYAEEICRELDMYTNLSNRFVESTYENEDIQRDIHNQREKLIKIQLENLRFKKMLEKKQQRVSNMKERVELGSKARAYLEKVKSM